jgi:anti-anti-sigma regulatory factor
VIFSLFGKKDGRADRKRGVDTAARTGPATGTVPGSAGARSRDQREIARLTAAKIDEIESEMIAGTAARPGARPAATAPAQASLAGTVFVPSGARTAARAAVAPATRPGAGLAAGTPALAPEPVAPTRAAGPALQAGRVATEPRVQAAATGRPASAAETNTSTILGDAHGAMAVEITSSELQPIFEEAAVLYANGQAPAAASVLSHAIRDDQLGPQLRQGWLMLMDLYQVTGRKDDYEGLAIDFSARFEHSAPPWDDTFAPQAGQPRAAAAAPAAVAMPAALDAQIVKQIEQVQRFAQRNRSVTMDLSGVRSIDPIGADLLLRVLVGFRKSDRELVVPGAAALHELLAPMIESGRRDPSDACWLLQLEMLRLLGKQQEFEDLSIEYCVTYEVSPPPWEPMPATIRTTAAVPGAAAARAAAVAAGAGRGYQAGADAFVLRGDVEGRSTEMLSALRTYASDRSQTLIDCAQLRRLDFVAAGELLNEVVALRSAGKYLVFKDLNHLVAALLAVMGIPDLAEVRLRRA